MDNDPAYDNIIRDDNNFFQISNDDYEFRVLTS